MMDMASLLGIARDRRGPYIGKAEDKERSKKLEDIIDKELAQKSEPKQDSERIHECTEPEPEQDSELINELKQPESELELEQECSKQPEPEAKAMYKQPEAEYQSADAPLQTEAKAPAEAAKSVESLINYILDSMMKVVQQEVKTKKMLAKKCAIMIQKHFKDQEISKADQSDWSLPKQSKWKKNKGKGVCSKEVNKSLPKTDLKENHKEM